MTTLGKVLAVLNFLAGIAVVTSATLLYTQRPAWLDKTAGAVDPWDAPASYAQLNARINGGGDQPGEVARANAASRAWGRSYARLKAQEGFRAQRKAELEQRLAWARDGGPNGAFFDLRYAKGGTVPADRADLLDLASAAAPVVGPGGRPLAGANTLLKSVLDTADRIVKTAEEAVAVLAESAALSREIDELGARIAAQEKIRAEVAGQVLYLGDYQVNSEEQRDALYERRDQLLGKILADHGPFAVVRAWHEARTGTRWAAPAGGPN